MIKFVKCKKETKSDYLLPGKIYTAVEENDRGYYSIKEFGGRKWHKSCFTVVGCPCGIHKCIKHRNPTQC